MTNQQSLLDEFAQQAPFIKSTTPTSTTAGAEPASTDPRFPAHEWRTLRPRRSIWSSPKDLSRLGRDYIMTGHYMERYFPEQRVRYISLLDGIDTGVESTANDITPFRAIMNDMYAKDISKKIQSLSKRDKQQ